ncbi:MAG: CHAT domain-containing protein [Vicinamibacterales bacterium]
MRIREAVILVWLLGVAPPFQAGRLAGQDTLAARVKQAADLLAKNAAVPAMAILEPLLKDPALATQPALHADVLFQTGFAHFQRNDYPRALDFYNRAAEMSRTAGSGRTEARALMGIGQCYKNQGAYARSLEQLRIALARYDALKDTDGAARVWMVIASVEDLTGRHRAALGSYSEAERLFGDAKHTARIRLLNEIGISYKNLGEYDTALDYYRRGLAAQIDNGDRYGQAVTLHNTAVVYGLLGEDERALDHYQRSLVIARDINERRGQSVLLGNLGELVMKRGDLTRAFDYFQQQLKLTRELGNRNEQALALLNLGHVYAARGELARARQSYEEARGIQRDIGAKAREASTLIALADLDVREGANGRGVQRAENALALATETEAPELGWRARLTLARAVRRSGQTDTAIAHLEAAAKIVNDLRASVSSDAGKIGFGEGRRQVFQELADSLLSAGRPAEALQAAEAGRARALADLLEQRQTLGRRRAAESLETMQAAREELQAARSAGASRSDELRRAGDSLDSSVNRLREQDPELASLVTAESPGVQEILDIAKRSQAVILEFMVTERAVLAWTVSGTEGIHATALEVDAKQLEAQVAETRKLIDPLNTQPTKLNEHLRRLYTWLIAPVEGRLPKSSAVPLIIIPDGAVALVPFAALRNASGAPLVARYALATAPSISVYRYTPEKLRAATSASAALVIADPTVPAEAKLAALPGARNEGQMVVRRLGPQSAMLLSGTRASEAAIKRTAANQRVLHFATHGLVSAERPLSSSVVLAPGEGDDGYLRAAEVFGLELSADLVVLSGCSTGLGRISGDGIVGLTRAFMYAGTPRVLVSYWDVNDRSTAYLMDRFYAARNAGESPAGALRTAQLATRRLYPNPFDWAAFVLVGEPR